MSIKVGDLIPIGAIGDARSEHVSKGKTYSSDEGVDLVGTMPQFTNTDKVISKKGEVVTIQKGEQTKAFQVKATGYFLDDVIESKDLEVVDTGGIELIKTIPKKENSYISPGALVYTNKGDYLIWNNYHRGYEIHNDTTDKVVKISDLISSSKPDTNYPGHSYIEGTDHFVIGNSSYLYLYDRNGVRKWVYSLPGGVRTVAVDEKTKKIYVSIFRSNDSQHRILEIDFLGNKTKEWNSVGADFISPSNDKLYLGLSTNFAVIDLQTDKHHYQTDLKFDIAPNLGSWDNIYYRITDIYTTDTEILISNSKGEVFIYEDNFPNYKLINVKNLVLGNHWTDKNKAYFTKVLGTNLQNEGNIIYFQTASHDSQNYLYAYKYTSTKDLMLIERYPLDNKTSEYFTSNSVNKLICYNSISGSPDYESMKFFKCNDFKYKIKGDD